MNKTYTDNDILVLESQAQDIIAVRRTYLDLLDYDFNTALLLSQLRYWYLPNKTTKLTKLRVKRDGFFWICKQRSDWWAEVRLTAKQFDRSLKILINLGLVKKAVFKFDGNPSLHVRLDLQKLHELCLDLAINYDPDLKVVNAIGE